MSFARSASLWPQEAISDFICIMRAYAGRLVHHVSQMAFEWPLNNHYNEFVHNFLYIK